MKSPLIDTKAAEANRRRLDRERVDAGGAARIRRTADQKFHAKPGGWRRS